MIKSTELKEPRGIVNILGDEARIFFSSLSTDSRLLKEGEIFVALRGEHFDAFDFIEQICAKKPSAIIYEHTDKNVAVIERLSQGYPECLFIGVQETLKYLQELARNHVRTWKNECQGQVIGITGSNGKTTTKEMLVEMLEAVFPQKVHGTRGNFNNHIGVPITLLGISEKHRYAVVELGTNHPGEIASLCQIADPDVGLITNVGSSHLEFFHTEKAIFVEKSELYNYVSAKKGCFVINRDDPFLATLKSGISFGRSPGENKFQVKGDCLELISLDDEKLRIKNSFILGDYNFYNLVASLLVAMQFTGNKQGLIEAAACFRPKQNRSFWTTFYKTKVFLDAYNANPSSMENALRSFHEYCKQDGIAADKALIILGDMNELGKYAEQKHKEIGAQVKLLGFSRVIFVGKHAKSYAEGFGSGAILIEEKELVDWKEQITSSDICFIKGSRSLKLETLLQMS